MADILRGEVHERYKETVEIAEMCKTILGDTESQRRILEKFTFRETREEREKRIDLTNSITRAVLEPVFSYFDSVQTADGFNLTVIGDDDVKDRVETHFSKFYRGMPLFDYVFEAAIWAAKLDPNAWMVFERSIQREGLANLITDIYPILISSEQAVDFTENAAGELVELAYKSSRTDLEGKEVEEFWRLRAGVTVHYVHVANAGFDDIDLTKYIPVQENDRYLVRAYVNSLREVPAVRLSAYLSDEHDREIGEPLYASAVPILKDIIRDKTFFDTGKTNHIRPEKMQYVKRCNHYDEPSGLYCDRGYLGGMNDKRCPACGGSGQLVSRGEMNVVTLEWPDRPDDLYDLAKIVHYVERPIDVINFYRSELSLQQSQVIFSVFSQQNVSAETLTSMQTATQVTVEAERVNNKLRDFAKLLEQVIELAYRVAFNMYESYAEYVRASFPQSFKFRTLTELIQDYEAAKNAGLPYEVLWSFTSDILTKRYRNDKSQLDFIFAVERWKPWKGKTSEEIAMIIGTRDTNDIQRSLWENWDWVIERLREESPEFHLLPWPQQAEAMQSALDAVMSSVTNTQTEQMQPPPYEQ